MEESTEIALKKYEIVARNIEFLDGWVMKITTIYGVFIVAVLANLEFITDYPAPSVTLLTIMLGAIGVIFLLLLWRIDDLMKKSRNTMANLEHFFGDVSEHEAIDKSWANGITTTILCGFFIICTMTFILIVLMCGK